MHDWWRYTMAWLSAPTTGETDFGTGLHYRAANTRMHYRAPEQSRLHYRVHNTRMHYQTNEASR